MHRHAKATVRAAGRSEDFELTSGDAPRLELAAFEAAIGTPFTVHADAGVSAALTLAEVERLPAPAGWEHFALLFDGPEPALPQWTYAVEHATMGTFDLFVGPVAGGSAGVRYEAVFNRPAPEGAAD